MKQKYLYLFCFLLFAKITVLQAKTISGTVSDTKGETLIGVAVREVGNLKNGTVTDLDGKYSIDLSVNTKSLIFTYLGKSDKKVSVKGRSVINVIMEDNSLALDEMVVVGYGAVKKKELTGAVAQISSKDLESIKSSDLGAALQGKISGVNVVASSGAPGSSSEILIRGISSITGSNTPLYVVDGVPQEGDPRISTNEIQTIDVLKDAASCAIYGTRGAAGVILITTKHGSVGKLNVSVNGVYGIKHMGNSIELMDTKDQTYFQMAYSRNMDPSKTDDDFVLDVMKNSFYLKNNTDLSEYAIINNTASQNYDVNITGGSKTLSYNLMAGYYDEDGVIINSGFNRLNSRANLSYKKGKWSINSSVGFTHENKDQASGSITAYTLSYYPYMNDIQPGDLSPLVAPTGENINRTNWILNSFNSTNKFYTDKTFGNIKATVELIKGLKFTNQASITYYNTFRHKFSPYKPLYDDVTGLKDPEPKSSQTSRESTRKQSYSYESFLDYKKQWKSHNIGFMGAFSVQDYTSEGFKAVHYDVTNNAIESLNCASGDQLVSSFSRYDNKLVGLIGRVQYNYKGKYMLSANVRRDGSSKFGEENRWGTFPSAAVAWNLSDEKFWNPLKSVANTCKLRYSYGTTGNQNFSPYSYSASIGTGYDYVFGNDDTANKTLGAVQTVYSNANVKWETSIQSNLGLDLAFLKNKITLTAEAYNTKKSDMLFGVTLPGSAGTSESVILNVGNMTNKGLEISLGYRDKIGSLNYSMNLNYSKNENEITDFAELSGLVLPSSGALFWGDGYSTVSGLKVGYPAGSFFLYKTDGIVDTEEKLAKYSKIEPTAKMGDLIYVDYNKSGDITTADRQYCGSGLPDYELGYNLNLNYKSWDFSANLYASIGSELMNGTKGWSYSYGRNQDLLYAWNPNNPITSIPAWRGDSKTHNNYKGYTDLWLEDGSYLRLKAITLGYSLPSHFIHRFGLQKCRFYVSGQNLYTLTKYSGYDPEVGGDVISRGLDRGSYPVSAYYMGGINIKF